MTGFTKVAFYKITTDNLDSLPVYDKTPIKLYDGELTNNIGIEITSNEATRTRKADNIVSEDVAETGYSCVLTVYGVSKQAQADILGCEVDGNGNLIMVVNGVKQKFGMFFETTDNDSNPVQVYLSKVTFGTLVPSAQTDEKGDPVSITLNLKGTLVKHEGKDVRGFMVFKGQTGFVVSGLPTEFYKPVVTSSASTEGTST